MKNLDKVHHFVYGYFISSLFQVYWPLMLTSAVMAGAAKETYDVIKGNKFDKVDFICTVCGGAFALLWMLAMKAV